MINIAIVEDDDLCLKNLQACLSRFEKENSQVQFEIHHYSDGKEFVDNYQTGFDIVFMDIEMPNMNGMQAAKIMRQKDEEAILIFVTRMAQYAIKGYEVDAFDFLVKPVSYSTLAVKLKKAIEIRSKKKEKKLKIDTENGVVFLPASSICYIEVTGHNLTYHTELDQYEARGTLADAEAELKDFNFCSCSRYCLVNLRYVIGVYDDFALVGKKKLEISRRKKKELMQELLKYFGEQGNV